MAQKKSTPVTVDAAVNTVAAHNAAVNAAFAKLPSFGTGSYKARVRNNPCECGCTGLTGARFVIGHDAKLHSRARAVESGRVTLDWIASNMVPGDAAQSLNIAIATARYLGVVYPVVEAKVAKAARKGRKA